MERNQAKVVLYLLICLVVASPAIIYGGKIFNSLETFREINDTETLNALRAEFDRNYNYIELHVWEHQNLNFSLCVV